MNINEVDFNFIPSSKIGKRDYNEIYTLYTIYTSKMKVMKAIDY